MVRTADPTENQMRWLIVLFICAFFVTTARADLKGVTIGFSQIGAESAWRTAESESTREEAAKRGVELKFSDAQGKQENQIKAIRAFIAQRVKAIILAPVVETGWEP